MKKANKKPRPAKRRPGLLRRIPGPRLTAREVAVRRVAWGVAWMFLLPVLAITFLAQPSYGGEGCGTWVSPRWDKFEVANESSNIALGAPSAIGSQLELSLIVDRCNSSLQTQRMICLVLIGLGVGGRLLVPSVDRILRET